jgi:transposase
MRPPGKSAELELRRHRAIELLETGYSHRAVAKTVQSSLSSVVRWQKAYRVDGQEGLRSTPSPGRPPKMSKKEKKKLVTILLRGPLSSGYTTNLWTLGRIAEVINNEFGVRYTRSNCWHILRALGWSCQKPEKRAKERDEEAIRIWKRWVWPQLKKNRTP